MQEYLLPGTERLVVGGGLAPDPPPAGGGGLLGGAAAVLGGAHSYTVQQSAHSRHDSWTVLHITPRYATNCWYGELLLSCSVEQVSIQNII